MPSADPAQAIYPQFTTSTCTWAAIFDKVQNPVALWGTYAPKGLGGYATVAELWEHWNEGRYIPNVGRLPAIRLIEERWGNLKNTTTGKGKQPAWRPSNNAAARKLFANFNFFVDRMNTKIREGMTPQGALEHFEALRNSQSLPSLQKRLQVPKKRVAVASVST
ncbi:hypothetical protein K523DRAFT_256545 [Schizophyllum commune Tattone D]|nr:hypothetical protein K523DRAFT_256545 [Schizophyllum commune Tattone D]